MAIQGRITILAMAVLLSACSMPDYSKLDGGRHYGFFKPKPIFMTNLPQGDDSYSEGVRDGCNTATGILGSGPLRMYGYAYKAEKGVNDSEYYHGYRIGYNYCTFYLDPEPL